MKNVTIYTTSTCGFCKQTKAFLAERGVAYTEFDVGESHEKAEEMMKRTGQMGVPVIIIADEGGKEETVIGFDQPKLEAALT